MNVVTSPRAEKLATTMALPVAYDADTYELYGYKLWVLDKKAASSTLFHNGIYLTSDAFNAAITILEQRVSRLNQK